MLKIQEHNATTGEIIEREMNAEELAQHQIDLVNAKEHTEKIANDLLARKNAEAKLAALGLTTDDLKALGL